MGKHFTPLQALAGGILIGVASVWLLAANGRIAGMSGILHGLVARSPGDTAWRAKSFIDGEFLAAGFAWQGYAGAPEPRVGLSLALPVLAGLLVGFGARLGGGCTSGHGVCGVGRRSARSLVAVAVFMPAGIAATFVMRHVLGVAL